MELYNILADEYDNIFPVDKELVNFVKAVFPNKKELLIDAGCASGALAVSLVFDGYSIIGIDSGEYMIKKAAEKENVFYTPAAEKNTARSGQPNVTMIRNETAEAPAAEKPPAKEAAKAVVKNKPVAKDNKTATKPAVADKTPAKEKAATTEKIPPKETKEKTAAKPAPKEPSKENKEKAPAKPASAAKETIKEAAKEKAKTQESH